MKTKLFLVSMLILYSSAWNQTLINTNSLPGAVGLELLADNYGHLLRVSGGTVAGDNFFTVDWSNYRSSFVELNGGAPIEIIDGAANLSVYDGVPAAPQGANNGFFFPDRFDVNDWTFQAGVREDAWHTITEYDDGAGIHLVGGTGYYLYDPSPRLGFPFTEFRQANQFTNVGDIAVTIRPFIYNSISVPSGITGYTNHLPNLFDYDGIDGTGDDFTYTVDQNQQFVYYNFVGFPVTAYNLVGAANNMLAVLQGAGPAYNLPTSVVNGNNPFELTWQYRDVSLEPGQTVLYWLTPKVIKLWNNANNFASDIDFAIEEVTAAGNVNFAQTDVSMFVSQLTFVTNNLSGLTANAMEVTVMEITGGMIESALDPGVSRVLDNRYWEIFYDTRHNTSLNDITFAYNEITDGIDDESRLTLVYRHDYDQQWTEWASVLDMANNTITAASFPGADVQFALALKSIIAIDGNFDGEDIWGTPVAISDQAVGWSDVNVGDLYVTHDEFYLYLGARINAAADWQSWGFLINTRDGGGNSDPWTHPINFEHQNLPDFVARGHFGMGGSPYAELREWDGSGWNNLYAFDSTGFFSEEDRAIVEVRIPRETLGDPQSVDVQFYITGNNTAEHGTFDAVPDDQVADSWNVSANPTVLDNFTQNIAVPVELVSFNADIIGDGVLLTWKTATEINNLGFEIYRKSDADWEKIGFVNGAGNSTEYQEYSFVDKAPINSVTYYQLKQIDYDGSFEFSPVTEVTPAIAKEFTLWQNYPNPFNPSTTIKFSVPKSAEKEFVKLEIFDVLGTKVATLVNGYKNAGVYRIQYDASNLSSGIYLYKLSVGEKTDVRRMTLLK